jgi:hypothetical protein
MKFWTRIDFYAVILLRINTFYFKYLNLNKEEFNLINADS